MEALLAEDIERRASGGEVEAQLALARRSHAAGDADKAAEWLRRAALRETPDAKAALGRYLLTEPPLSPEEGLRLTTEAADSGQGDAAHLLAVLEASGQMNPANWPAALARLRQAAELGHEAARAQLAFLAGDIAAAAALANGATLEPGVWERLHRAIDMRRWLASPRARVVSQAPRIAVVEKFLSSALCDWVVEHGRRFLQPAPTDDPDTGERVYGYGRTNSAAEFTIWQTDVILHMVRARISALAGPPTSAMEGVSILHYEVGQQFFPHFDFLDTASPGYARQVEEVGQRVLTFLIYLNDDYQGGETAFPVLGWRYKGRKGDALLFWNIDPAGQPDRRTLHAGTAPTQGEKWLFSQWVRGKV